ncbi:MAG: acyl carrier protein, partial [Betaproteobacteria bacterium]|nr:acyl carrier protein [Betaproteobacteria bacterium]
QVDIDSFDFLNAIIRLHENLGVEIPEADYGQLATLDGTVDYLAKKCSSTA